MKEFIRVYNKAEATLIRNQYTCGHYTDDRFSAPVQSMIRPRVERIYVRDYDCKCSDCKETEYRSKVWGS